MNTIDIFYIAAAVAVVTIAGCAAYLTYLISKSVKSIQHIVERIEDTTTDITMIKEGIKYGAISLVTNLLSKVGRGGGNSEK